MVSAIRATSRWPVPIQLICAVAFTLSCLAIQLPIESRSLGDPFAVFLACVFMTALLFGRLAGATGVALSSVLSALFFEPHGTLQLFRMLDLLQIQIYAGLAIASVLLADQIRRTLIAQSERNETLSAEDKRKALRLREVAHRVANNFSSLDALMRLRAKGSSDPKMVFAFEQASELIHVVARLSNRLNNPDDCSRVDSRVFMRDVCEDLKACAPSTTVLDYSAEGHELPLNIAVILGLIINELVTNVLKYAFPDGRPGHLQVRFSRRGNTLVLAVEDDGVGMNETVYGGGIGLPLLNGLARSLDGTIEFRSSAVGTVASVRFPTKDRQVETTAEPIAPYLH